MLQLTNTAIVAHLLGMCKCVHNVSHLCLTGKCTGTMCIHLLMYKCLNMCTRVHKEFVHLPTNCRAFDTHLRFDISELILSTTCALVYTSTCNLHICLAMCSCSCQAFDTHLS